MSVDLKPACIHCERRVAACAKFDYRRPCEYEPAAPPVAPEPGNPWGLCDGVLATGNCSCELTCTDRALAWDAGHAAAQAEIAGLRERLARTKADFKRDRGAMEIVNRQLTEDLAQQTAERDAALAALATVERERGEHGAVTKEPTP